MWYFIIGIIYVMINGLVRKIYDDSDWLLALVQMLGWPLFVALFIYSRIIGKSRQ